MKINTYNRSNNNSFQGIHTAKIICNLNNSKQCIDLYQIDKHDKVFLKQLRDNIDLKRRMPGLCKYEYERWHEMLELATDEASREYNSSFIAAVDNKPCGIISFNPGKKNFHLNCICTWPIEFGEKVKLAGQSLFYQMFKVFDCNKSAKLQLEAITNGPFDTVSKYKKLGFKPTGALDHKVFMEANKYDIQKTLINMKDVMEYIPQHPQKEIRLAQQLEI